MDEQLIQVTVESRSIQSSLVRWEDYSGKVCRTYIMSALVKNGKVPLEELELGIPFDAGWSELLSDTQFSKTADCIAETLERAKITDWKSLQNAPRKLGHICGEDIYQIVATLNRLLKE